MAPLIVIRYVHLMFSSLTFMSMNRRNSHSTLLVMVAVCLPVICFFSSYIVILALTTPGSTHTPYRDSKLTRLLQDRLADTLCGVVCGGLASHAVACCTCASGLFLHELYGDGQRASPSLPLLSPSLPLLSPSLPLLSPSLPLLSPSLPLLSPSLPLPSPSLSFLPSILSPSLSSTSLFPVLPPSSPLHSLFLQSVLVVTARQS